MEVCCRLISKSHMCVRWGVTTMNSNRRYTCFVISPIGKEGSPERINADEVWKYLIIPALEKCGFAKDDVVRSDLISKTGRITDQITKHIMNDDLCVVDLTGLNANVMYEHGLRRGYGKPCIVLAKDGQELPFDVKDDRTIFYDTSKVPTVMAVQELLEKFTKDLMEAGFVEREGADSVSSLSRRLHRIEDKLDSALNVMQNAVKTTTDVTTFGKNAEEVLTRLSPIQAFNYALTQRDLKLGEELMPVLEGVLSKERFIDQVVAQLTSMGSTKAAQILEANWDYIASNFTFKQRYEEVGCYISYCNRADCEPEYLEKLVSTMDGLLDEAPSPKERAGLYNQKNRLYFGAYTTLEAKGEVHPEYLDIAIQALEKAIKLNGAEPSYYYNLATCQRKKGDLDAAVEAISKCMDQDSNDDDHLKLAYELYTEKEDPRAVATLKKLSEVNPYLAKLVQKKKKS